MTKLLKDIYMNLLEGLQFNLEELKNGREASEPVCCGYLQCIYCPLKKFRRDVTEDSRTGSCIDEMINGDDVWSEGTGQYINILPLSDPELILVFMEAISILEHEITNDAPAAARI